MRSLLIISFIFAIVAGPTLAQSFYVGHWVEDPAACAYPDTMLELSETTFFGYEDTCELTSPVSVRGIDAILFDAVCRGEGGENTHRLLISSEGENGLMLHHYGRTTILETCE